MSSGSPVAPSRLAHDLRAPPRRVSGSQHEPRSRRRARPTRALLEQLVARRAEQQDRRALGRVEHVLEQVEEGRLGPVDVVDQRDQRAVARPASSRNLRAAQ